MSPCGRGDAGSQSASLTYFNALKLIFFLSRCVLQPLGNMYFHKVSLICGWLCQYFLGTPELWVRGAGAISHATAGCTARTKFCLPITLHVGGQGSSWITWYVVVDSTDPSKAHISVDGYQIFVVERGQKWGTSYTTMIMTSLRVCLMAKNVIYFGKCSMWTWE